MREAILDVVAIFSGSSMQRRIDVTIRSPFTKTCMASNALKPGQAAITGEKAKLTRYGASVLPLSFESLGRLGPDSLGTLETLRHDASTLGQAFFAATGSAMDWRRQLETCAPL